MTDEPTTQRNVASYPPGGGLDAVMDRFAFHPATEKTGPLHDEVRLLHSKLARKIQSGLVPAGRHQSLALTALQESMMWCNAAIACDSPRDESPQRNPHSGPQINLEYGDKA